MKKKPDWHERFSTQLKWTLPMRNIIYSNLNIQKTSKILEPGCGTGALLTELGDKFHCDLHGIDVDIERIKIAKSNLLSKNISVTLKNENIKKTSYGEMSFDFIFTHYLFLWIRDLENVFTELFRILKSDGKLIILAEPDFGGLIEEPDTNLKHSIQLNLRNQGANPNIGRQLPKYWTQKFEIIDQYTSSIPWLSLNRKSQLFNESIFLETILDDESFNFEKMKSAILSNNYFLYIPVFTFVLKKVPKSV